jgi:hypothetical protein
LRDDKKNFASLFYRITTWPVFAQARVLYGEGDGIVRYVANNSATLKKDQKKIE